MRYILVGVLLALCLTVPAYGQSTPDEELEDGDGTITGTKRPNPRDNVCTARKQKRLTDAEVAVVSNVVEGKAGFEEVLEFICKISNSCLQKMSMQTNGTLNATQVTTAICSCGNSNNIVDVIMSTVKMVDTADICPNVIEALFTQIYNSDENCTISRKGIRALTKLSVPTKDFIGCNNVNSAVKLFWRRDVLKGTLQNMTAEEFETFLTGLTATTDTNSLIQAPCEFKLVGKFVANKLDFVQILTAGSDLLKLLPFLPVSTCNLFSYEKLVELELDAIKALEWPCVGGLGEDDEKSSQTRVRGSCSLSACGKAIAKTWLAGAKADNSSIAVRNITTTLGNLAKCVSFKDVVQQLSPGQCVGVPLAKNPRDMYKAAKSCKVNKDAQNLTSADIISMGCYAIKRNLQRISDVEVCTVEVYEMVRGCLNNTDKKSMPDKKRTFKILAGKCIGDFITLDDVQTLKEIIAYAPCHKLRAMNDTIKTEIIEYFPEDIDATKLPCLPVSDLSVEKKMIKGAAKRTNSHDLMNEVRDNIMNVREIDQKPELSAVQFHLVLDEILTILIISELTDDEIRSLKWFIVGLKPFEIYEVELDKIQVVTDVLCSNTNLDGRQTRAMFDSLMRLKSDSDPENPAGQLSPTDIEHLGSTCVLETLRYVNNLTTESLMVACVKFGMSDRLYRITNRTIREYAADKCFDVLSGNVAQLGNLFFDVSIENINSVDPVDLAANSSSLTKINCASQEKLTVILDKIATINVTDDVETMIEDTPGLILFMGSDSFANNEEYAPRLSELLQDFEEDGICNIMQSDADREYLSTMITGLLINVAAVDGSERTRRDTIQIACTVLSSYSADQLKYLTKENIEAIDDFENCISVFGSVQNWDTEQLTTLRNKFNTYLNDTSICDMTSGQISQMGSIGYSLTHSEINCLKNLDLDAMIALGRLGGWTHAQEKALLDKYMKGKNLTPGSYTMLTSTDISTAGHLICGLSKAEAAKIDPVNFKPVIRQWSQTVLKCSVGTLEGLYTVVSHANAFGDIDEYDLNDMGIIAAGIPVDLVSKWNSNHISSLSDSAILHLSSVHVKKLTANQLEEFDQNQKLLLNTERNNEDGIIYYKGDAGKAACSLIMVVMTIICCCTLL